LISRWARLCWRETVENRSAMTLPGAWRGLGFAMEWDSGLFPYAWSWNSGGGVEQYPLWGEGPLITLQPSTSPVGRFADLVKSGAVLQIPGRGAVTTEMTTGFVRSAQGPWETKETQS